MSKKFLCCILIIIAMISTVSFAVTADVQINGKIINFTDSDGNRVDAQIISDRTMVPLRKIFEDLGCDIEWIDSTKTVIATKGNTKITLQINNKNATKSINGKEEKIVLSSEPIIIDGRTLVPLRFVAESLGKQVAWDPSTYTAIIIDYDYFANSLKSKAPMLYDAICNNSKDLDVQITRNYYDNLDSTYNNTATINTTLANSAQNINITFSGSNDLMKEIISESWNDIDFNIQYLPSSIKYSSNNAVVKKMLASGALSSNNVSYKELELDVSNNGVSGLIQSIINVQEKDIDVNTFKNIDSEWTRILSKISYKTVGDGTASFSISNIHDINLKYFDLTRLDNIIYLGSSLSKAYSAVNKAIFNYDLRLDRVLYDFNAINISGNLSNGSTMLTFSATTEYDEKIVYNININY